MKTKISEDLLSLLEKLISFESITPQSNGSIEFIAEFLSKIDFKCHIRKFGDGDQETTNLYATYGDNRPNLCFAGHVDVVPVSRDKWSFDPFKMTIKDNLVYGRGVVDMKGAIACAMLAVSEYLKNNKPNGMISFLITSDEEGTGKFGTKKMLEYIDGRYKGIDFCILGEPTTENNIGDVIKIGRRGSVNYKLELYGIEGHVAYPDKAYNAIPDMIRILKKLNDINLDSGSEYFQSSNLEVTSMHTDNNICNVIGGSVKADFNIRFNDQHNSKSLHNKILKIISGEYKKFNLKRSISSESFIQRYSSNIGKFSEIVDRTCKTKSILGTNGGTSDARFIHNYTEIVEFGLNSNMAHKVDECTQISDLQALYNVYYQSCLRIWRNW